MKLNTFIVKNNNKFTYTIENKKSNICKTEIYKIQKRSLSYICVVKDHNSSVTKLYLPTQINKIIKRFTGNHITIGAKKLASYFLINRRTFNIYQALQQKAKRDFILNFNQKILYVHKNGIITPVENQKYLPNHVKELIVEEQQHNFTFIENKKLFPADKPFVSGIYQAPPDFFSADNVSSNTSFLFILIVKFVFCLFHGESIKAIDDIVKRLKTFLEQDSFLNNVIYYPLAQHIITNVCANIKFPCEILYKITENRVDYTFFKEQEITSGSIIEALVIQEALQKLWYNEKSFANMKIIAQNPENPLGDHEKFKAACYLQMKQPYGDFRVELNTNNTQYKTGFLDIKMIADVTKHLSLTKGHITLTPNMDDNDFMFIIKRYKADMKGKANILNTDPNIVQKTFQEFKNFDNDLENLIKNKKIPTSTKKNMLNSILDDFDRNPKIQNIMCSRLLETDFNFAFENFMKSNYLQVKKELDKMESEINLTDFLSTKNQTAKIKIWHNLLLNIMKKMPEKIKKEMLENYHKFKMIEYEYPV